MRCNKKLRVNSIQRDSLEGIEAGAAGFIENSSGLGEKQSLIVIVSRQGLAKKKASIRWLFNRKGGKLS